jgi:hypothetical protein
MTITNIIRRSIEATEDYEKANMEYEEDNWSEFSGTRRGKRMHLEMTEWNEKLTLMLEYITTN